MSKEMKKSRVMDVKAVLTSESSDITHYSILYFYYIINLI